jgi:hypothetical protein
MRRPLRIGHGHVGVGCPRQVLSKRLPRRLRSHRRPNPSTRPCPGAFAFASASTPMSSSAPASTSRSTATATVSPSPAFAAVRRRRGKQNASTSTSNHSTHLFGRIETPLLGPLPSLETGDTDTRPVFARHVEDAEDASRLRPSPTGSSPAQPSGLGLTVLRALIHGSTSRCVHSRWTLLCVSGPAWTVRRQSRVISTPPHRRS